MSWIKDRYSFRKENLILECKKTDLLYHYGKAGLFCSVAGCNKFEPSIIKSRISKQVLKNFYLQKGNQIIFLWQRKVILQEFSFRLFWALFVWLVVNIVR